MHEKKMNTNIDEANPSTTGMTLRIITRQSPLALLQVEELQRMLPDTLRWEVTKTVSYGDRHKDVSLMDRSVAADFFTRELDEALLDGRADVAVHSAKDLPYPLPAGLEVIALTEAKDKTDSLVTRHGETLATLPPGSRIGTSSAVRKAELLALRTDIGVVPIRGTIEERIAQVDDGKVDALIVATCALDRLGLSHRASERLPFRTHPLQGNLAVTASTSLPADVKAVFAAIDIRRRYGKVHLVGFGPGDPELITVKGQKALERADVICYDDLTNAEWLQQFEAEKIYVGKRAGRHSHAQDEINDILYQNAIAGRDVVRLKGGDAMLFAHGREEIDWLRERMVSVDVVPGVSSGMALSSLTQIPLTHRGMARSVALVLGHASELQTTDADTLLYYMGGGQVSEIARRLMERGRARETPVALVTNVSLPAQRAVFSTLGELKYAVFRDTPVLIMVGDVVGLEAPSHVMRTYNTGTQSVTPLITITPSDGPQPPADRFDWVVFTSRYGVRYYRQSLDGVRIASVGPVTSDELRQRGVERVDYESDTESAEGLLRFFAKQPPCNILLPRSNKGLAALSDGLRSQGHSVTDLPVYTNTPNSAAVRQDLSQYDKVLFTSPSTVEAFRALYGEEIPKHLLLIAKGKTTYEAIQTI